MGILYRVYMVQGASDIVEVERDDDDCRGREVAGHNSYIMLILCSSTLSVDHVVSRTRTVTSFQFHHDHFLSVNIPCACPEHRYGHRL